MSDSPDKPDQAGNDWITPIVWNVILLVVLIASWGIAYDHPHWT